MAQANSLLDWCIAELLERHPETIPVFMRHRMACVGCDMVAFTTVAEALAIYQVDDERFVSELERAIQICAAEEPPVSGEESK